MTSSDPKTATAHALFEARWQAALEQPETLKVVDEDAAEVTIDELLGSLGELAEASADEGLITSDERKRVAAAIADIRQIMGGVDPEKLAGVAAKRR